MSKPSALTQFFITSLRKILHLLIRRPVELGNGELVGANTGVHICYVLQSPSLADALVLEQACIDRDLPRPSHRIKPDTSSATTPLARLIYLLKKRKRKIMNTQFIPYIEALDHSAAEDIHIVPVSIFWGRAPDKTRSLLAKSLSGSWATPGILRKLLVIMVHGRHTFVQFNESISLKKAISKDQTPARISQKLCRVLRVQFRHQKEAVIGPDLSHRRTLVNGILKSANIRDAIDKAVQQKKVSRRKMVREAKKYANEIAADFSYPVIRTFDHVLSWLWNKLYDGIEVHHVEHVQHVAKDYEIVYLPCHRSHIDYLLLSYVLYHNGLAPPHIAAGINLNLPVVGDLLRRAGAFYIRRTFGGNRLYTAVFNEYLHTILSRGFSIAYFIEGGRSRTGRLLDPKTGMLSMTVANYLRSPKRPIAFIPVYIGYERVIEANSYARELRGKSKKSESVGGIVQTYRQIKHTFGKVHVNFGKSIQLNSLLDQHAPQWREQAFTYEKQPVWLPQVVNELAGQTTTAINSHAVINPVNMISLILLAAPNHALEKARFEKIIGICEKLLQSCPYSESIENTVFNSEQIIDQGVDMHLLWRIDHPLGDILKLNEKRVVALTYFRNNILHVFALPSLIACLVANSVSISRERLIHLCTLLYPYLKSELFLRWDTEALKSEIESITQTLCDTGLITHDNQTDTLSIPPGHSVNRGLLCLLADMVSALLQRYYLTIAVLLKRGAKQATQKQIENLCQKIAQRLSVLHGENAPEFFDKTLFQGFIQTLRDEKLLWLDENKQIDFDHRLADIEKASNLILPVNLRQSILQITHMDDEESTPSLEQAP